VRVRDRHRAVGGTLVAVTALAGAPLGLLAGVPDAVHVVGGACVDAEDRTEFDDVGHGFSPVIGVLTRWEREARDARAAWSRRMRGGRAHAPAGSGPPRRRRGRSSRR